MKRRIRNRRRRLAALALIPAALAVTAGATVGATPTKQAGIDSGKQTVTYGKKISLRGVFPGAKHKKVDILYRAAGESKPSVVQHTTTGPHGFYSTHVRPPRSGFWSAALAGREPFRDEAGKEIDGRTGKEHVRVRSMTRAKTTKNVALGETIKVRGKVKPGDAGRLVVVRAGGAKEKTRTNSHGRFSVRIKANKLGTHSVRVKARTNDKATGSSERAGKFTAYRNALASWYGPGLYGNGVACGGTLTPSTIGVANKTLPCGTKVKFRYHGHTVTAPVIDRGPYSGNREYDLTEATKNKLHFPGVDTLQASK